MQTVALLSSLVVAMTSEGPLLCESVVAGIVQTFHGAPSAWAAPETRRVRRAHTDTRGQSPGWDAPRADLLFAFEHHQTRHLLPGMAEACEAWYLGQHAQHDSVAPQLISYLLLQSLRETAKAAGAGGGRWRVMVGGLSGPYLAPC